MPIVPLCLLVETFSNDKRWLDSEGVPLAVPATLILVHLLHLYPRVQYSINVYHSEIDSSESQHAHFFKSPLNVGMSNFSYDGRHLFGTPSGNV